MLPVQIISVPCVLSTQVGKSPCSHLLNTLMSLPLPSAIMVIVVRVSSFWNLHVMALRIGSLGLNVLSPKGLEFPSWFWDHIAVSWKIWEIEARFWGGVFAVRTDNILKSHRAWFRGGRRGMEEDQRTEWLNIQAYFLDLRKSFEFHDGKKVHLWLLGLAALAALTQELSLIGWEPGRSGGAQGDRSLGWGCEKKLPLLWSTAKTQGALLPKQLQFYPPPLFVSLLFKFVSKLIIKQLNIKGRLREPWNLFRKPVRKLLWR